MSTVQEAPARPEPKPHTVSVTVNEKTVMFHQQKATGTEIKATAISQGVAIQPDFSLFIVRGHGNLDQVGDRDEVTLHEGEKFRAVAPDDNS
jgi:Multiubiquitin